MKRSAKTRAAGGIAASLGIGVIVAAIAGVGIGDFGCSTPQPPPSTEPQPILIGVSLGLTGSLASTSVGLKNAAEVAQGYINANGGVLGRPIQFQVQDDQTNADPAGPTSVVNNIATTFIQQGVVGYLGPVGSGQVLAMDQQLFNAQIVQITPSATSVDLEAAQPQNGQRYLFRTTPADDLQGKAVVQFALEGPGGLGDGGTPTPCNKMAIVEIANSYGTGMDTVITQVYPNATRQIVKDVQIPATVQGSYKSQADAVLAAAPQCMVLIAYDDIGDQFMSDFTNERTAQPTAVPSTFFVIGTDGIYTDGFIQNGRVDKSNPTSTLFVAGVYGTNPDTNPLTSQYGDFKTEYTSYYPLSATGQDAPSFAANMFDAAILLALAIEQTGNTTDKPTIRDNLIKVSKTGQAFGPDEYSQAVQAIHAGVDIDYNGASGPCDMDNSGDTVSGYIIWEVQQNGTYSTVGRISPSVLQ